MNIILKIGIRFLLLTFAQVLILNQIEIGFGIQFMIYPLFIFLLPVETSVIILLLSAFAQGLIIDSMSNTYGLHASSLLVFAFFRPIIFKLFAPRDGYDPLMEINLVSMGFGWFLRTFGLLLIMHHLWFFLVEMFKWNEIVFVLQKTGLSVVASFLMCVLLQYLFIRKRQEK
jgi:hypothetical protein